MSDTRDTVLTPNDVHADTDPAEVAERLEELTEEGNYDEADELLDAADEAGVDSDDVEEAADELVDAEVSEIFGEDIGDLL